ncbi:hypothetical protein BaRGS_00024333, partial [Batillaria attramentaria]
RGQHTLGVAPWQHNPRPRGARNRDESDRTKPALGKFCIMRRRPCGPARRQNLADRGKR